MNSKPPSSSMTFEFICTDHILYISLSRSRYVRSFFSIVRCVFFLCSRKCSPFFARDISTLSSGQISDFAVASQLRIWKSFKNSLKPCACFPHRTHKREREKEKKSATCTIMTSFRCWFPFCMHAIKSHFSRQSSFFSYLCTMTFRLKVNLNFRSFQKKKHKLFASKNEYFS